MPSTENHKKLLDETIEVGLDDFSYFIDVYDTTLGKKWLKALRANLEKKLVLEKNFCFLGWAQSKRNIDFLVKELNANIEQINNFKFYPAYPKINLFTVADFQNSKDLPVGKGKPGLTLRHDACNMLHRYFEDLQGTAWNLSDYYKQADPSTKYAIRQLNNICHEIESWVLCYRKFLIDPDWTRPSQITTFLNAPRYDLSNEDLELFKENRYNRELGGVYLHWSQVGKTLMEVYRDEHAPKMTEALCSEINHQKFYSGEFDIEWGRDILEFDAPWHRDMMDGFRKWLAENGYDWEDPKLALGYIKLGQVDLDKSFGENTPFAVILEKMSKNLNIRHIKIKVRDGDVECKYPYRLEDNDWKTIQMEGLKRGHESHSLR